MVSLREYQQDIIERIVTKINAGAKRVSVAMPIGTGQITTALLLSNELYRISNNPTLFIFSQKASCDMASHQAMVVGVTSPIECITFAKFIHGNYSRYQNVILLGLPTADRVRIEPFVKASSGFCISFFQIGQAISGEVEPDIELSMDFEGSGVYETRNIIDVRDIRRASNEERQFVQKEIQNEYNYYQMQKEIKHLKELLAFQETLLHAIGIPGDAIKEGFDKISNKREELKLELNSKDEEASEKAIKILQDYTAEIIVDITKGFIKPNDREYYQELLQGMLGESIWEKLEGKSRTFLITARNIYDNMKQMNDGSSLDYSGVCLPVTKALEVEVTKRFFSEYIAYLKSNNISVAEWPFAIRKKQGKDYLNDPISEDQFTLGHVVPIMGYYRDIDSYGHAHYYVNKERRIHEMFLRYARNNLFCGLKDTQIEIELEKDFRFIEKVRLDYRNPSAHKGMVTIITATECMDYVIDVQHMLSEMLSPMTI